MSTSPLGSVAIRFGSSFLEQTQTQPLDGTGVPRRDYYDIRQAWKTAQQEIGRYQTTSIPFCMDLAATIQIFIDENEAAKQALATVKERHARRWQTKEGMYRLKQQLVLPDVRDEAGDVIMEDL